MSEPSIITSPRSISEDLSRLWALLVRGGRSSRHLALDFALLAIGDLLTLYSINEGLAVREQGGVPVREMLMFVVGLGLSTARLQELLEFASRTLNEQSAGFIGGIFAKLQALDLEAFEAIGSSEAMVRLTMDTTRVSLSGVLLVQVCAAFNLVVLSLLYFFGTAPLAATLVFAGMAGLALLLYRNSRALASFYMRLNARKTRLFAAIEDLIEGITQIKLHGPRRRDFETDLHHEIDALEAERDALSERFNRIDALGRSLFFSLLGLLAFVLPLLSDSVEPQLGALLVTVLYVFRPVAMLVTSIPELNAASTALVRLERFEARLDETRPAPRARDTPARAGPLPLRMRGVRYRYPSDESGASFGIGPLDLELHPGELVFVTGANGSGKSTFLKVLTGLYPRTAGELSAGGVTQPHRPQPAYREHFAAIFLDFVLFDQLHGLPAVDPRQVEALLRRMRIDHKVEFRAGRFSTTKLSTGQRKRLAMVVALLQDRPLYVFDEWAADQDPEYRADFYRELLPELRRRGKTVIAVTHDDPYFGVADRRLHFEQGRLVEL